MDKTGSMSQYIEKAKADSTKIIKLFQEKYPRSNIRYSYVSYKDHKLPQLNNLKEPIQPSKEVDVVKYFDFNSAEHIQREIVNINAKDGDDWP